jgi:uncharacterized protein YceH (UPF0502 family)
MEKSLASPEYYPMTLNSIVTACNQKNNRDPVVEYDEGVVATAVHEMMTMGLVAQADPGRNARANRFQHQVFEQWNWERRQRAIMCELLLRGPQTVGELRTRASRMVPLTDLQTVNSVLDELAQASPPWVVVLPRQVGQSAIRHDHTLYLEGEERPAAHQPAPAAIPRSAPAPAGDSELSDRVQRLETEVADLRRIVDQLTS